MHKTVAILGGGPAGVSCALYVSRSNIDAIIITNNQSALNSARSIDNYYGFHGVTGKELYEIGIENCRKNETEIKQAQVTAIEEKNEVFNILVSSEDGEQKITSDYIVLALGASRNHPSWKNLSLFEGTGVSHCAVCDAFLYKQKEVIVAGSGAFALHEVETLLPIAKKITLCTDGKELETEFPKEIKIFTQNIKSLEGGDALERVILSDGTEIKAECLFVAIGAARATDLAHSFGLILENFNICVDANMQTNVDRVYAVGDCVAGYKQIAKAVSDGMNAGLAIVKRIREKNKNMEKQK